MWYNKVIKDITLIPDAIEYFQAELIHAKKDCKINGSLEKASSSLPGIVEQRFSQLQEIEAILEYLNIELKSIKSYHFRKYLEAYARALSTRECDKYVEGESEVVEFEKLINEFALLRNQWLSIHKALDIKQWQLTNIIKLRCSGFEDAMI